MAKRFVFFYLMKEEPERIREVVPAHIAYWHKQNLPHYLGGPFADRTGGLISFEAPDLEQATAIIEADPFIIHALVERKS